MNTALIERISNTKALMESMGVRRHQETGLDYYTSYTDLYDWELYYDTLALAYLGNHSYGINGIQIFLANQRDDGFIPRHVRQVPLAVDSPDSANSIWVEEQKEHCKPFLFQTALIISKACGDMNWLTQSQYDGLKKYLDHWLNSWDLDHNGLCEWNSGPHSGADSQLERIGSWGSRFCEGTDLNCFLHRECKAAALVAGIMGRQADVIYYEHQACIKAERVQELLWNEAEGIFYDRSIKTGEPIKIKSGAAFLPLWAGIATPAQATALVEKHLKNPDEFWTALPIPGYARSEPYYTQYYQPNYELDPLRTLGPGHCNWNGGTWLHWNYMFVHGLSQYGFREEASCVADKLYSAMQANSGVYEWYNADTGEGCGLSFWAGATVTGFIMPTELELDVDPTRLDAHLDPSGFESLRPQLGLHDRFEPTVIH